MTDCFTDLKSTVKSHMKCRLLCIRLQKKDSFVSWNQEITKKAWTMHTSGWPRQGVNIGYLYVYIYIYRSTTKNDYCMGTLLVEKNMP